MSFVYYTDFYKSKLKPMYILSISMQMICLIFVMLIFEAKFSSICLSILIYNLILLLMSQDKVTKAFSNIVSIGVIEILSILELYKKNRSLTISILLVLTGYSIIMNLHLTYHFYVIAIIVNVFLLTREFWLSIPC